MSAKYAVVELTDGTITSISLDKYLASKMKIIEECDAERLTEKTAYWDRIYHPKSEEPDKLIYHFYNAKLKKHLWTSTPETPGHPRHRRGYVLVK